MNQRRRRRRKKERKRVNTENKKEQKRKKGEIISIIHSVNGAEDVGIIHDIVNF